jgi:hypothetical protein
MGGVDASLSDYFVTKKDGTWSGSMMPVHGHTQQRIVVYMWASPAGDEPKDAQSAWVFLTVPFATTSTATSTTTLQPVCNDFPDDVPKDLLLHGTKMQCEGNSLLFCHAAGYEQFAQACRLACAFCTSTTSTTASSSTTTVTDTTITYTSTSTTSVTSTTTTYTGSTSTSTSASSSTSTTTTGITTTSTPSTLTSTSTKVQNITTLLTTTSETEPYSITDDNACLKKGDEGFWTCADSEQTISCEYVCDDYDPADCGNGADEDTTFCVDWNNANGDDLFGDDMIDGGCATTMNGCCPDGKTEKEDAFGSNCNNGAHTGFVKTGDTGDWACPNSEDLIQCVYVCDGYDPADCGNGADEDETLCANWNGDGDGDGDDMFVGGCGSTMNGCCPDGETAKDDAYGSNCSDGANNDEPTASSCLKQGDAGSWKCTGSEQTIDCGSVCDELYPLDCANGADEDIGSGGSAAEGFCVIWKASTTAPANVTTTSTTTAAVTTTSTKAVDPAANCLKNGYAKDEEVTCQGSGQTIVCTYVCDGYVEADCENGIDEDAIFCDAWINGAPANTTTATSTTMTSVTTTTSTIVCAAGFQDDGYGGCNNIDECALDWANDDTVGPCDVHAKCTDTEGSFECECNSDYNGDGIKCLAECVSNPFICSDLAECSANDGCKCRRGYAGDGIECTDLNECTSSDATAYCDVHATCTNSVGSYKCECNTGWMGPGRVCIDVKECMTSPCPKEATCTEEEGSYSCQCNPGWTNTTEDHRDECYDIDECEVGVAQQVGDHGHTCDVSLGDINRPAALCTNLPGSFNCTCGAGYLASGTDDASRDSKCNDINECATSTPCEAAEGVECRNTQGSYVCECGDGWEGPGDKCWTTTTTSVSSTTTSVTSTTSSVSSTTSTVSSTTVSSTTTSVSTTTISSTTTSVSTTTVSSTTTSQTLTSTSMTSTTTTVTPPVSTTVPPTQGASRFDGDAGAGIWKLAPAIFGGLLVVLGLYLVLRRDKETKEVDRRNSAIVNEQFAMMQVTGDHEPKSPPQVGRMASTHHDRSATSEAMETVHHLRSLQNTLSSTEL